MRHVKKGNFLFFGISLYFIFIILNAPCQTSSVITTAVPFLNISPDSRASGMGDVGVASIPDANSLAWNPAKYAFIDKDLGVSILIAHGYAHW